MDSDNLIEVLLDDVKGNLLITWEDSELDKMLTRYIKSSIKYFNEKTGSILLFEEDSSERELLYERVRYQYNYALDEFENNFSREISSLIQSEAIKDYLNGETNG